MTRHRLSVMKLTSAYHEPPGQDIAIAGLHQGTSPVGVGDITIFAHLRSYLVHWKLTTEARWERSDAADEKNAAASELSV